MYRYGQLGIAVMPENGSCLVLFERKINEPCQCHPDKAGASSLQIRLQKAGLLHLGTRYHELTAEALCEVIAEMLTAETLCELTEAGSGQIRNWRPPAMFCCTLSEYIAKGRRPEQLSA